MPTTIYKSKKSYKCGCARELKGICPVHSKIKMAIMLNHAAKAIFSKKETVMYSYLKLNKKPIQEIIANMLKRLEKKFNNQYNCIMFYDNDNNHLIHKHTP